MYHPSIARATVALISMLMVCPRGWAAQVTRAEDQVIRSRARQAMAATPLRMDFTVTELGDGLYDYEFVLKLDNHDSSWEPGQSWGWVIAADAQESDSPLADFVGDPADLPIGPWDTYTVSMGYHNGPTLWHVLDEWSPVEEGDLLTWSGISSHYTEELLFSTLVGNGELATFEPMHFMGSGCELDIAASDHADSAPPGSQFAFRFDVSNGCDEEGTFDAIMLEVTGSIGMSRALYHGADVILGTASTVGSVASLSVPPSAEGEYTVKISVERDGVAIATDQFHLLIE
ncbi:MAG: hypothetical protein CME06_06225 [Gemmatimonadetes bacterium]|nr:hypothetical protein [Gemmatimonadota bacterium]